MEMHQDLAAPVSAWKAISKAYCPACREGALFTHGPLHPTKFLSVHANCPVCGIAFEPEPGFFWGAMYFNYAFNIAMLTIIGLVLYFGFGVENEYVYIVAMLVPVLLAIPITARFSRVLWLYFFGPFSYTPRPRRA
jgi:uncharacterized protein (DUF983 family)